MVKISPALHLHIINLLINGIGCKQFLMGIKAVHFTVLQDQNAVRVLYAGNTLGNNQLCSARYPGGKSLPNPGVRSSIHSTGGIIQNQYFRIFQQSPCNAEALFLPAGYIAAPLLDPGIIFIEIGRAS